MREFIYKYFPCDALELVFAREGFCGVKCSFPQNYNDPFELFLGVDLKIGSELLAFYRDVIQEIPQWPTTCFSRFPTITPMWAHYAQNHSGFVLEFDVDALNEAFPRVGLKRVAYKDAPEPSIEGMIQRAAVTKKPRHSIWLQDAVFFHSYFSKHTAWSYEAEVRLVASEDDIEDVGGNLILFIPLNCVTSIVVGKNFPVEKMENSKNIANSYGLDWFREVIGKSHPEPFFINYDGVVNIYNDGGICPADFKCSGCNEPVAETAEMCPWCGITDEEQYLAANSNPLRLLDMIGRLGDYRKEIAEIKKSEKSK